jgi:hypothetical protein
MTNDTDFPKASPGMLWVVAYWRIEGQEFFKKEKDTTGLSAGLCLVDVLESERFGDEDHRSHFVYGIFREDGRALWVQEPNDWPDNRWNNNWQKPLPDIFSRPHAAP